MKRSIYTSLVAAGVALGLMSPTLGFAAVGGTVEFKGSISDVTCLISGGGDDPQNPLVEFDEVSADAVKTGASPVKSFDIKVNGQDCTDGTKVRLSFSQSTDQVDPATGNVKLIGHNVANSGTAPGVQIQIKNNAWGKSNKVFLGKSETDEIRQIGEVNGNTATLSYTAQYVPAGSADEVGIGFANASLGYTLNFQ